MLTDDLDEIVHGLGDIGKKASGKTFLVTGGAGFIGSWFCDALIRLGAKVVCIDNFSSGSRENINHLLTKENFRLVEADVTSYQCDIKPDYIVHMASIASPPLYQKSPVGTLDANVIGTKKMLELAKESNVKGFLFTSTSEVYGNPPDEKIPTNETYYGYVNSYGARCMYDEGKRCSEAYIYSYWKQFGIPVRVARIFNTYGPRLDTSTTQYGRALIKFFRLAKNNEPITIYGTGKQTRSFCYITDQIAGLLKLLLMDGLDGTVVNIGNDKEISIDTLADKIISITNSGSEKIYNAKPNYDIADDPMRRQPDIKLAKKILSWEPKVSLDDGIRRLL